MDTLSRGERRRVPVFNSSHLAALLQIIICVTVDLPSSSSIVRRHQEHLIDPPPIFVLRFDTLPADIRASATNQTPHWTRPHRQQVSRH